MQKTAIDSPVTLISLIPLFLGAMKSLLRNEFGAECLFIYRSAKEAITDKAAILSELIIVDVTRLEGATRAVSTMRGQNGKAQIAVFGSAQTGGAMPFVVAGAAAYVYLESDLAEVRQAIKSTISGGNYLPAIEVKRNSCGLTRKRAGIHPRQILSPRELEVFKLVGNGLSLREIAGIMGVSIKTVETYAAHIRDKMHCPSGKYIFREAVIWKDSL